MRIRTYPSDCVFVTGTAKTTKDDAISFMYSTFSLSLVVDPRTNKIFSLSCNMVMQDTVEFVQYLLCGYDLVRDMDQMVDVIKRRFFALAQRALIVALKDAQNRYIMQMQARGDDPYAVEQT